MWLRRCRSASRSERAPRFRLNAPAGGAISSSRSARRGAAQGKVTKIDRLADSVNPDKGEGCDAGSIRRRLIALFCLLGLLLPMLPLANGAASQHVAALAADIAGGPRLEVDAGVADQPAMLGKLLSIDSGDSKRIVGGGKPALPPCAATALAWGESTTAPIISWPEVAIADSGIRRGDRSPTGPPAATA